MTAFPVQVCRVYIGSFNGVKPIREDINPQCKPLFEKEQADLLADLHDIPVRSCDRKARCRTIGCIPARTYQQVGDPTSCSSTLDIFGVQPVWQTLHRGLPL